MMGLMMINQKGLTDWANKVSKNKKGLDKEIFDGLIKIVLPRLERDGYTKTYNYLNEKCVKSGGRNDMMAGVILLRNNSKTIKDKLWGLNKNEKNI